MHKIIKKFGPMLFIIIIGMVPLASLFHEGLQLTHDGQDHLARIANFYQSLSEGNLIPRWGANLNWGYGHPVMMFLYPLPSYIASLFHFFGFSLTESLKIVFGLTFILSGLGMYLWISRLFGSNAGTIASLLYLFAPYRFVNLYVRGAIGEHVAFAFIPFVLFFITRIFLDKQNRFSLFTNFLGIVFFTTALILSHNALSILFLAFAAFLTLVLFLTNKDLIRIIVVFCGVVYGFLLSSFFWIPAYVEGKYTLRDIVTGGSEYADRFVISPINFILPSWSFGITGQLSVQIGIVHIALIILGIIVFLKLKKKTIDKKVFVLALVFLLVSLFMMLKESDFIWSVVSIIQKFQFPWRFLSLTVLTSALLGSYFITGIKDKKKAYFAIGAVVVLIGIFYSSYWRANGYLIKSDEFFKTTYHGTTDTGESSPIWSIRFMEETPTGQIEVLEGEATIEAISRSTTKREYIIEAGDNVRIRENTLYFPGWNIYVNDRKLDVDSEMEFQDQENRGVMTFRLNEGANHVSIVFEDTKLRSYSSMLSIISLLSLFVLCGALYIYKKK